MLAADNWCLKVDDKVYGPYTADQLKKFAGEGRLAGWSLVSPAGANRWREAQEEKTFAAMFGKDPAANQDKPKFGKRAGSEDETTLVATANSDQHKGQSNFILIFDVVSAAATRVEAAILSLGPGFRIADNVWTVACEQTAIGVRNAIAPYLLPRESLFIVDATRGRSSWQNYPPEVHAKLTAAWVKTKKAS
ncbi:MAG: GYF domain-containing protein [Pseudomonadota bacterium]